MEPVHTPIRLNTDPLVEYCRSRNFVPTHLEWDDLKIESGELTGGIVILIHPSDRLKRKIDEWQL